MQLLIDKPLFVRLEAEMADLLVPLGFERQGHQYEGPFGSCYVDFVFHQEAYRLVADGRELCLLLEHTTQYAEGHFGKGWRQVMTRRYPATATGAASICQEMCRAIALERHR